MIHLLEYIPRCLGACGCLMTLSATTSVRTRGSVLVLLVLFSRSWNSNSRTLLETDGDENKRWKDGNKGSEHGRTQRPHDAQ
ncbi:hypothetical protein LZ31DRAFT_550545 [Colletotrichum somersetense]|nr:hypothetical protein LZ31DRAFT_550545 [Colletotrichum somersetense]